MTAPAPPAARPPPLRPTPPLRPELARVQRDPAQSGRLGDLGRLLPILGAFLLISPLVRVFAVPVAAAGVPLIIWYIFGVWAALILGAALLGRRIREAERRVALDAADEADVAGHEGAQ